MVRLGSSCKWGLVLFVMITIVGMGVAAETFVVGVVALSTTMEPAFDGFKAKLDEYVSHSVSNSVIYLYNGPTTLEDMPSEVGRLLAEDIDVLFTLSTPATAAAMNATVDNHVPVVFTVVTDAVASGFADTLALPGRNITGVQIGGGIAKELEWLLQIAPTVQHLYVPHNPADSGAVLGMAELVPAAEALGIELVIPVVGSTDELLAALAELPDGIDAIFLNGSGFLNAQIESYVQTSLEHKLPLASVCACIESGVLLSYGYDFVRAGIQAARLAHQIFHGALPEELPIETADFFLGINLATADAIGLMISDDVLDQAAFIAR